MKIATMHEHLDPSWRRRLAVRACAVLASFVAVMAVSAVPTALAADSATSVDVTLLPMDEASSASPDAPTADAASGEHRGEQGEPALLAQTGDGLFPLAIPLALAVLAGATMLVLGIRGRRSARSLEPGKGRRTITLLLAAILAVGGLSAATPVCAEASGAEAYGDSGATVGARGVNSWGDSDFDIIGTVAVGATISVECHIDPSYPSSVKPRFRWMCSDLNWAVLGTGTTLVIPPETEGKLINLAVTDESNYVSSTIFVVCGRPSMQLVGDPVITGDLDVGSTVTVEPNVNVGANPTATWYAGAWEGALTTQLGTGLSLELPASARGLYVTAVVTDAQGTFDGSVEARSTTVVEGPPVPVPTIGSTRIAANGNVTAACSVTPNGLASAIALEALGDDGAWTEVARQDIAQDGSAEITGGFAAWLDDGSVTVRAVAHGPYGPSSPSAEVAVTAQIAVSVPLSMTCAVAGDGTIEPTEQLVRNTGELNVAIARIDTSLGSTSGSSASWTCSMDDTTLFEGPFGGSSAPAEARAIAPGESAVLRWEAKNIEFDGAAPTATPMAYGTIAYAVSIAAG